MVKKVAKEKVEEKETSGTVSSGTADAVDSTTASKSQKDIKKVVFTRKDGSTREFNEKLHGDDFVKIADEFAATNARFIAERQDL